MWQVHGYNEKQDRWEVMVYQESIAGPTKENFLSEYVAATAALAWGEMCPDVKFKVVRTDNEPQQP